ncbi:dTDP-glucose 4,6-dehydratase [Hyphomicrobium sp.]|uniref:dTDP-glucose 4,6-dehydratase n=1 Tax=Hyphomicrobium sp. TaxID=82 RepID=UPI002E35F205|nr:dTDP-glucose 4,6-dehydratase [Hyphomicrobium sp.]HEX2841180.1 dTDP-glucose 4,6-dehydratase [Hyphomicrobium sp.]
MTANEKSGRVIAVTGGAGFIGSAVCRRLARNRQDRIVNIDKLTYAGNLDNLSEIAEAPNYVFYRQCICDGPAVLEILRRERVDAILHLAAESHVDRSIEGAAVFLETNVIGTFAMLEAARTYWSELPADRAERFRFVHVSTDEVYGDLQPGDAAFHEDTPYDPHSPYSASKASADHLVSAWRSTYGLPVIITNCSNNYGPYHFPEKLIPLVILNALDERPLPVYGTGENIRDWLFVDDHAEALEVVLNSGTSGRKYNIGGAAEKTNIDVVRTICSVLDEIVPRAQGRYADLITFEADRPGHDFRYAIDARRIDEELGWRPRETFETGIRKTIRWFLENQWWWEPIRSHSYGGERLGLLRSDSTKLATQGH